MSLRIVVSIIVLSLFAISNVSAEVQTTGSAGSDIKGRKPNTKEYRRVLAKAKVSAVESYLETSQVKLDLYDRCLRSDIEEQIDDYVMDYQILREDVNKQARQLRITLKAVVNESRLDNHLRRCKGPSNDKNKIAFVFVARQQEGPQSYRVIVANNDIENGVKEIFLNNAFQVTSNTILESRSGNRYRKDRVEQDYAADGDVDWEPPERAAEVTGNDFFAFGTFDIGVPEKDEVTGQMRVSVLGNAELLDLHDHVTLSVIGNIQEIALGRTGEEAIANARMLATRKIAQRMVAQLNAQGIQ